jgi:acyl carrier protein
MNDFFNEVKEIIRKYAFDKALVENASESSKIIADLRINSARIVDIVLDIEEKYDIEIDDKSLEKIITIQDAINIIKVKLNK